MEARENHQPINVPMPVATQQPDQRLHVQKPECSCTCPFVVGFFFDPERCPHPSLKQTPRWPPALIRPQDGLVGSRGVWEVFDVVASIDRNIQTLDFS